MLCGDAHHIIYSVPEEFPEWALPKKTEICKRIRSMFKKPGYEYSNEMEWQTAQQGDAPESTNGDFSALPQATPPAP
jgi:hypothetical protein